MTEIEALTLNAGDRIEVVQDNSIYGQRKIETVFVRLERSIIYGYNYIVSIDLNGVTWIAQIDEVQKL